MLLKEIEQQFPYVSVVAYGGAEYVGIISNQDQYVTTMFVYTSCRSDEDKKLLLDLGEIWWWESNRMIPINLFLKADFALFSSVLTTFNIRDSEVVKGPSVSIAEIAKKRSKRRNIQLIKKVK